MLITFAGQKDQQTFKQLYRGSFPEELQYHTANFKFRMTWRSTRILRIPGTSSIAEEAG